MKTLIFYIVMLAIAYNTLAVSNVASLFMLVASVTAMSMHIGSTLLQKIAQRFSPQAPVDTADYQ